MTQYMRSTCFAAYLRTARGVQMLSRTPTDDTEVMR